MQSPARCFSRGFSLGITLAALPALPCYNDRMDNIFGLGSTEPDRTGQLTGHDRPGLAEPHFALDLYEVAALFDAAGIARNRRSLSRYCMAGKLDCQKVETLNGEEWRIDEQSVHRLIAQILEQQRLTHLDRPGQGETSPLAEAVASLPPTSPRPAPTAPDLSHTDQHTEYSDVAGIEPRQASTQPDRPGQAAADERLLKQLERENDLLRDQLVKKDAQIDKKDKQIDDLIERGREDKLLIQNFQRKLGMLEAPKGEHRAVEPHDVFDRPRRPDFFVDRSLSTPRDVDADTSADTML